MSSRSKRRKKRQRQKHRNRKREEEEEEEDFQVFTTLYSRGRGTLLWTAAFTVSLPDVTPCRVRHRGLHSISVWVHHPTVAELEERLALSAQVELGTLMFDPLIRHKDSKNHVCIRLDTRFCICTQHGTRRLNPLEMTQLFERSRTTWKITVRPRVWRRACGQLEFILRGLRCDIRA